MRKAHSIALAVVVALVAAAPAQADQWWVPEATTGQVARQEQGRHSDPRLLGPSGSEPAGVSSTTSTGQQIMRQERGRQSDRRLFSPSGPAPVLVAGQPEGFDLGDAAVGGAVAFAIALLAAATFVFAGSRRQRTA